MKPYDQEHGRINLRQQIKDNFIDIYSTKPLNKIRVSELMGKSNNSGSSLYYYFNNIDEVYCECQTDLLNLMAENVVLLDLGVVSNDKSKTKEAFLKFLIILEQNRKELVAFITGSEKVRFYNAWKENLMKIMMNHMRYSKDGNEETKLIKASFATGAYIFTQTDWLLDGCRIPKEIVADTYIQILFEGLEK